MAVDDEGLTVLHHVAARGYETETITVLLEAGADVAARDDEGRTALHRAAANPVEPEIAKALLNAGANVAARDRNADTPLHSAATNGARAVALLLEAGADPAARNYDNL